MRPVFQAEKMIRIITAKSERITRLHKSLKLVVTQHGKSERIAHSTDDLSTMNP